MHWVDYERVASSGVSLGCRPSMANELRRARRYSLTAAVEIADLGTGVCIRARTSDLSLVGCYIDTLNPLPPGTHVKISITHENETFTGAGTVVYSASNMGMGIKFLKSQHDQQSESVLQQWLRKADRSES